MLKMATPVIVIATPHARNDSLEQRVRIRLPRHQVVRLRGRDELTLERLKQVQPALVFFPHWSWLIPDEIHSQFECVVFHMTDLPYGRGGSPLQNLIARGHKETQLSALRVTSELDAGPVYMKRPLSLTGTAEEILRRAAALMEEMIVEIVENRPKPAPQQGDVVLFKRRRPEDGNLAPLQEPERVYDFIRMLDADGYPRAFMEIGQWHLEFSDARLDGELVEAKVHIKRKDHA
jgi:methionyl-tRNA formyltransferase